MDKYPLARGCGVDQWSGNFDSIEARVKALESSSSSTLKSSAMSGRTPGTRIIARLLCSAFSVAILAMHSLGAEKSRVIPAAKVDQSVVAELLRQGNINPKVISHIDLTKPFATSAQWTFVAVQEGDPSPTENEDHGPITVCLVKGTTPDCAQHFYQQVNGEPAMFDTPHHLLASRVVYASLDKSNPLLLVKVCTAESFDSNCGIATALYRYDKRTNRFICVFLNVTGRNNNQATRFVERGPLRGDLIVDYPTEHAPYTYWLEVYRAGESGRYIRILRYRGRTGYNDGNPLAVVDSEMPDILRHLGLWQHGDALPIPEYMPPGCKHLFMRRGEEWCK